MISGISYVTLCMSAEESPHVSVSLYPDAQSKIQVRLQSDGVPLLNIQHGDTEVKLWPHVPDHVTDEDLDVAQRLVEATTTYLNLCERVHAELTT